MFCNLQSMLKIRIGILFIEGKYIAPEADPLCKMA